MAVLYLFLLVLHTVLSISPNKPLASSYDESEWQPGVYLDRHHFMLLNIPNVVRYAAPLPSHLSPGSHRSPRVESIFAMTESPPSEVSMQGMDAKTPLVHSVTLPTDTPTIHSHVASIEKERKKTLPLDLARHDVTPEVRTPSPVRMRRPRDPTPRSKVEEMKKHKHPPSLRGSSKAESFPAPKPAQSGKPGRRSPSWSVILGKFHKSLNSPQLASVLGDRSAHRLSRTPPKSAASRLTAMKDKKSSYDGKEVAMSVLEVDESLLLASLSSLLVAGILSI